MLQLNMLGSGGGGKAGMHGVVALRLMAFVAAG